MQFLNPLFLYGLAAGTIPIVIHLLFRRRFQRVKWAAMKFLLAAYKRNKTSLLLENILLLLLRILIFILLALMFARPSGASITDLTESRKTQQYILVVDNSYSMGVRDGNISPFERARKEVRTIIKKAKLKDSVTLITLNEYPKVVFSYTNIASQDRRMDILQKFDEIKLSEHSTNVIGTINLLQEQASKKYKNKQVFIITDCQKKPWSDATRDQSFIGSLKKIRKNVSSMSLIDVGVTSEPLNLAVVEIESDGIIGTNILNKFVAHIRNFSTKDSGEVAVNFLVNGKKQKTQYVSVAGGEQQKVAFFTEFDTPTSHTITIELGSDQLATDNKRHLAFKVVENVKILVIDGDKKEKAFESETDYIATVLGASFQNVLQTKIIGIGQLTSEIKFSDYNVIILANIQTFDDEKRFDDLEKFVSKGGGLFIWLGDKVPYKYYNQQFFKDSLGLLPGEILGNPIGKAGDEIEKDTFSFASINKGHKVFRYFRKNKRLLRDLKNCLTYRFFPIEISPDEKEVKEGEKKRVTVLASYDDPKKRPAIVERLYEKGKVILMATTADREWNNFNSDQFGHVFYILVHEFIQYLVTSPATERNFPVGLPIVKEFDNYIGNEVEISVPYSNEPITIGVTIRSGHPYRIQYDDTWQSGTYTIKLNPPKNENVNELDNIETFAVNIDPQEGNIARMSSKELRDNLKSVKFTYSNKVKAVKGSISNEEDKEYWKFLLILILILCALETLAAMLFGRYKD